mgnify:FL=1
MVIPTLNSVPAKAGIYISWVNSYSVSELCCRIIYGLCGALPEWASKSKDYDYVASLRIFKHIPRLVDSTALVSLCKPPEYFQHFSHFGFPDTRQSLYSHLPRNGEWVVPPCFALSLILYNWRPYVGNKHIVHPAARALLRESFPPLRIGQNHTTSSAIHKVVSSADLVYGQTSNVLPKRTDAETVRHWYDQ